MIRTVKFDIFFKLNYFKPMGQNIKLLSKMYLKACKENYNI